MSKLQYKVRSLREDLGELLEEQARQDSSRNLRAYSDDPVAFIEEVLGGSLWAGQREIAEAVLHHPLVTVRSCHASGKDWLAARLSLWWTYARGGLVILTGPTATQIEEILMRREVRSAFRASGLHGKLHVKSLRPGGEGAAGVLAKTSSGVSSLTGFHDAEVLFCITEAQHPELDHAFDAGFACATGAEDRLLVLGNPTQQSGRFYRSHQPSSDWFSIKIAASDIPNVQEGRTVVPGLLTSEGVERFASEYGESSGVYASRVLAEFPDESEEGLFRRSWLEEAAERWRAGRFREAARRVQHPVAALDVARFGADKSVLCVRRGPRLDRLEVWGKTGLMATVERAKDILEEEGITRRWWSESYGKGGGAGYLVVDEIGIGAGVLDRFKQLDFAAAGFNSSHRARDKRRFANSKAEMFWNLRERLEEGSISLPPDRKLHDELMSIRWSPTAAGRIKMESKSDLKNRIGRSPDRADAVAMAYYDRAGRRVPGIEEVGVVTWQ